MLEVWDGRRRGSRFNLSRTVSALHYLFLMISKRLIFQHFQQNF